MELVQEKSGLGRREARRMDRRDAILAVAGPYFLQHGYAGTTMSAIAAEVGGSKATLWSYFASKEELFEAVLDRKTAAYRAELSLLLDACGNPERTLRSFCLSYVAKITGPEAIALHRLIYSEVDRFPEIGKIFYERAPLATWRLVGGFIATAMERGLLREDDPIRAARTLTSLCMSETHQLLLLGRLREPAPERIAADADAAMDIFMRAYRP
ncbi:TetR family transcriptional regulator [Sphingomonas sp. Root710]|uniref:TetR/AcrR family transcriptional regulator n=1 Tax=Sphingomonas sp. Root710 TaxID=1736594 RepID=UPI0007021072|nr:TetR/AcrR family transcriptional regulator [Sphingomonas sp. Root710]KRB86444.1 TetR family transcriptional regulator [Sphingomonas sp. Root710]